MPDAILHPAKAAIALKIRDALRGLPGLQSMTFVGSFVDSNDLSGISDLDTVVVLDRLTPEHFASAVRAVGALTGADIGFSSRQVRVNATLGPLKFDGPEQVVVHLMLYDIESHRQHVLKSPFTCLDWERSSHWEGVPLRDIYPARQLQPNDFVAARRGIATYLQDLESGTLSFRRLEPSGERMIEVTDRMSLDRRHTGEYAYHILHNLIVNSLKMRTGQNRTWDAPSLEQAWELELPNLVGWLPLYRQLRAAKVSRSVAYPTDILNGTRAFVEAFSAALDRDVAGALLVRFVRHARTDLNDGTFLGTRRDPGLAAGAAAVAPLDGDWGAVYSSPLRRALDTARHITGQSDVRVDSRLAEIDYGLAEGLTANEARARFTSLREAWDHGVDVPFPEGEGNKQVLDRIESFLASLGAVQGRVLAVTHNVVMRITVAHFLGLDLRGAHRLQIEHLEALELLRIGGRWVPNWDSERNVKFLDQFSGWRDRCPS